LRRVMTRGEAARAETRVLGARAAALAAEYAPPTEAEPRALSDELATITESCAALEREAVTTMA